MPDIDFKEISPSGEGQSRDQFELFAREFLEMIGGSCKIPRIVFANPVENLFLDHILMMDRISALREALLDWKRTPISEIRPVSGHTFPDLAVMGREDRLLCTRKSGPYSILHS